MVLVGLMLCIVVHCNLKKKRSKSLPPSEFIHFSGLGEACHSLKPYCIRDILSPVFLFWALPEPDHQHPHPKHKLHIPAPAPPDLSTEG